MQDQKQHGDYQRVTRARSSGTHSHHGGPAYGERPLYDERGFCIRRGSVACYLWFAWMFLVAFLSGVSGLVTYLIAHENNWFYRDEHEVLLAVGVGVFVLVSLGVAFLLLAMAQARALSYRLEGSTLRVDSGVVFLSRKAIPLDRVTDLTLTHGPLMALCGIWGLAIQTAGAPMPEAFLYGLEDPEKVRDLLLAARDRSASVSPSDH